MFHYNTPDKPWIHSSISFYFQQFNHPKLFGVLMTTRIVACKTECSNFCLPHLCGHTESYNYYCSWVCVWVCTWTVFIMC